MDRLGNCLALAQGGLEATLGRGWLLTLLFLFIVFAPFILGAVIGRMLGLKELSGRISVVLMVIFFSLAPFVFEILRGRSWKDAVRWGIDLAGGTNLVYAIDVKTAKDDGKSINKDTLDKMVSAIAKRINPSGAEEVTVRRVGLDRIEVIIPGADRDVVAQKKRLITKLGSLEFGILANNRDHRDIVARGTKLPLTETIVASGGRVEAMWHDATKENEKNSDSSVAFREVTRQDKDGNKITVPQYLIVKDIPERTVSGKLLTSARPSRDDNGKLCVSFNFNSQGAIRMSRLTRANMPDKADKFGRRLAILLDGVMKSAPTIQGVISNAGQITGDFTPAEIEALVGTLNAGALEVPLIENPISEFTISPLLGADVQNKGLMAIFVSAACVFVFMLVYYRLAGLVADLSLVLNILMVVGAMAFISAAFTLPGLAGLVLTIGMAVDSNVLIYERMREELERGSTLRLTIQNGFDKALSAIVDGNVTSLITAVILYMIGSDLIKGFAVTLFIGLAVSMFSVLYFGHLMFDIIEQKKLVKTFNMMKFLDKTNFDFLGSRKFAYALSGAVIVAGMLALVTRGQANMDIDFSGGTMAVIQFVNDHTTDEVRNKLETSFEKGISLERLTLTQEEQKVAGGKRFRIRTFEPDQAKVVEKVNEAFKDPSFALVRVTMNDFEIADVTGELDFKNERFKDGKQADLKFDGELSVAVVTDYITKELESMKTTGKMETKKYPDAALMLGVTGKSASSESETPSANPKYREFLVRATNEIAPEDFKTSLLKVQDTLSKSPVFEEINAFDTSVGDETKFDALMAVLASLVMITIYIWVRFEKVYFGYAAVAALAHDVLVTLGAIAIGAYISRTPLGPIFLLEDFKINMNQIACLLTIVGYSLNDTIVIFDRIREIKGKSPNITESMINQSVNETLSRTLLTALTCFIVVVVLYLFGGEGIHGFAFSMIVGVITGCYSTIYIANPILLWLVKRDQIRQGQLKKVRA